MSHRHDWEWNGTIYNPFDPPEMPVTDDVKNGSIEKLHAWKEAFLNTDAGKAYTAACVEAQLKTRSYPLEIAKDGSFRVEDVEAGVYDLQAQLQKTSGGDGISDGFGLIASGYAHITVPPMPNGRSDEPLQIGQVILYRDDFAVAGEPLPDMTVSTLNGKPLRLSELRGHFVLLDLWATWCMPCVQEVPELKSVYDAFGKDGRLEMVGLSLDAKPQDAAAFVQANHIPWRQATFDGDAGRQTLKHRISGDGGIPQAWLINPDGILLDRGLQAGKIQAAVAAALSK
jgi:peroxiredoxin